MLGSELLKNATIIVDDQFKKVPLSCPVCEFLFRDAEDHNSYCEFQCCAECSIHFAWPNKDKWIMGWRPPLEMVSKFRQNRVSVPSYIARG